MGIKVKILGSNSAAPAHRRHHTSQLVNVEGRHYLIDCGEATQLQMARYKIKAQKINNIFISHLHGDHYLGLIGLLSTMHLQGRKASLNLYAPQGLSEIITLQLKHSETVLNYQINFFAIDTTVNKVIHEDSFIKVSSIPLNHRIPCSGFLFEEKSKKRRINKAKIPEGFSVRDIVRLKHGEDILDENGTLIYQNEALTFPPKRSYKYAYCSDTKYDESVLPIIQNADLLYHESTFTEEHLERADNTYHSTAKQAATIAVKGNVERLLLGHFSVRYKDLTPILDEAQAVFSNSALAIEGEEFILADQ